MTLWYLIRSAGLGAVVLLSIATGLGALGTSARSSPDRRVILQYLHRAAALLGLALLAGHITTILLDHKSHVGVRAVYVPMASDYRPLAVSLGMAAAYLFVLVALFGLARGRMAVSPRGARRWRAVHSLAYVAWGLGVTHGFLAGEDSGRTWVRAVDAAAIGMVVLALGARLTRPRRRRRRLIAAAVAR